MILFGKSLENLYNSQNPEYLLVLRNYGINGEKNVNNSTIPTVSLPVSGKTIVLDAGHGVPDEEEKLLKPMDITQQ